MLLLLAGAALLVRGRFVLPYRWQPEQASEFSGLSLILLAGALGLLGVFAWIADGLRREGFMPMPRDLAKDHPARRRTRRLVWIAVAAIASTGLAFLLASEIPNRG